MRIYARASAYEAVLETSFKLKKKLKYQFKLWRVFALKKQAQMTTVASLKKQMDEMTAALKELTAAVKELKTPTKETKETKQPKKINVAKEPKAAKKVKATSPPPLPASPSPKESTKHDFSEPVKIVSAKFYQGSKHKEIDPEQLSGKEMEALLEIVEKFAPKGTYFSVNWDTFEFIIKKDTRYDNPPSDGPQIDFPREWLEENIDKEMSIRPNQYGLNAWPSIMSMKFIIGDQNPEFPYFD